MGFMLRPLTLRLPFAAVADPGSWSQLVLDPTFDASSEEAQVYLLGFCDDLYSNDFTLRPSSNYTCPMQGFNSWLDGQSKSDSPNATYLAQCGAATGIPLVPEIFDSCIIAWSRQVKELTILSRSNKVVAMYVPFMSRHQFDVPYDILRDEWHRIEDFIVQKSSHAPSGVHKFFWSSFTYWWYDTNGLMLQTAYSSVGIALLAAAAIILMSSRSFRLTLFSTITIAYVLASVTATLVALGWHLGFLEGMYDRLQPNSTCRTLKSQSWKFTPSKSFYFFLTSDMFCHIGRSFCGLCHSF
jgi:protein dispatched 1